MFSSLVKFAGGPCYVSASPTHVMLIPFSRVSVVALLTLDLFFFKLVSVLEALTMW